jgi:ATP/maltotriose-dependent transcriptional regulator MalT/DNA-binding SARP family transcriptional activator
LSDIQYVYPLIHNKVTPPHYVTPTLRRGRLLDWLHAMSTCRAIVVAADAGYGKTTLAWQWEREVAFPCYWYKLDRNDRDWSLHISYLIEAINQRHPGFGRRAHSMLEQLGGPGSSRPGVAAYLLAEMYEKLTEPCTFIIDDWQFVASVTEVRGLWNQILRDAPPTCRFIFLSRAKPQLQFARFKTHAGYAEMRTDALRFTDREINELFRDIYSDPLDPIDLVELERRTEGWAASLQLVEVSLRERRSPAERRAFIQSITANTDTDLFSFLGEEVLDQQDDRTRNFLQTTSILHQMTPELAERLSGIQDGARLLSDLEQRGLFTNRLDTTEARYRYHGLFRDFLEKRLHLDRSAGEIVGLHIHAASYFETHEEWPEAIHHYLSADLQPQAARLIARHGEDVAAEGRVGLIDEWIVQLPPKTIRENARLSLLKGEALGMRGEWDAALDAITRARAFFSRKGDRRVEALACLKLSTVLANHGDVVAASSIAAEGLQLAPSDALAIQLRLRGNLAITTTWMEQSLSDVVRTCQRIAVEAKAHGWDHFAAIALHNWGTTLRHMGKTDEAIRNLRFAARFWAGSPVNPFADNSELVAALLAADRVGEASSAAESAVVRTAPWPRPNAEARYGKALVLYHKGRLAEAIDLVRRCMVELPTLGPTMELLAALLIECLWLEGVAPQEAEATLNELPGKSVDPRLDPVMAPARAIVAHAGRCCGSCLSEASVLRRWDARGATHTATLGLVKIGSLALEHGGPTHVRLAVEGLGRARDSGVLRSVRWWLRRYVDHLAAILQEPGSPELVASAALADPDGWREALVEAIPRTEGAARAILLETLTKLATKETTAALGGLLGSDVAEVRRQLVHKQAPRLFVRSFGTLAIHRGSWAGPAIAIERKRMRTLLGLLVAYSGTTLTRDLLIDIMWPDSDPSAAVNSLNQTVFQLRRAIDPEYRDGESASYVISTVDVVQFNSELVLTDLQQFRKLATRLDRPEVGDQAPDPTALVELIGGEFLADLKYDDWASRLQMSVHAEVRDVLLQVATGRPDVSADLSVRAACALVELDAFDEAAHIAMAGQLNVSGKRVAAKFALQRYVRRLKEDFAEPASPELLKAMVELGLNEPESTSP